jgi:GT2 family glycosyltransferase
MTNLTLQHRHTPKFSIIIPNYNGSAFIKPCLDSLIKSLKDAKAIYEIIIIDNASQDDSLSKIKNLIHPPIGKIIKNSTNLGFAPAVNQGIKLAQYKYIVLCNNDLTIDKKYFSYLINAIKDHPQYSAFVGTVLNKEGTKFESQGLKFHYSGKCDNILNKQPIVRKLIERKPEKIWGASAALVTYEKKVLEKIGYFDEVFFAYEEDVDLALRLHYLKYKTLLIPQAICYHLGGGTSNKMGNFRHKMDLKNWIFLIIKNYSFKEIILNFFGIIDQRLRNISGLLKNSPDGQKIASFTWTYKEIKKNIPKMIKKRKNIQNLLK